MWVDRHVGHADLLISIFTTPLLLSPSSVGDNPFGVKGLSALAAELPSCVGLVELKYVSYDAG
jgi:hypothetical protein